MTLKIDLRVQGVLGSIHAERRKPGISEFVEVRGYEIETSRSLTYSPSLLLLRLFNFAYVSFSSDTCRAK